MRPARGLAGEVRGSEAFELTSAVNAGCGFACTVHANSTREALNALVNAVVMAGDNITEQIVSAPRSAFVVYCDRDDINRADPTGLDPPQGHGDGCPGAEWRLLGRAICMREEIGNRSFGRAQ